jgi:hypothetical protein
MTKLLDKEVEEFDSKIKELGFHLGYLQKPRIEKLKDLFRQSLTRYVRAVIEEAMPEEETGQDSLEAMHPARAFKVGFNTCRTRLKANLERLLGSKEE